MSRILVPQSKVPTGSTMVMQTLQHELDTAPTGPVPDVPALRRIVADQAAAHAEEVRLLRQRVAVLEDALAAATAGRTGAAASSLSSDRSAGRSVARKFDHAGAPAVVAVVAPQPAGASKVTPTNDSPDQGFAQAWREIEEISFEERVAEKAFFQASSIDQPSRKWLLDN